MTVIAMTREMGTRGKDVAAALADRLEASVVHHELVDLGAPEPRSNVESTVTRHLESTSDASRRWRTVHDQGGFLTDVQVLELARAGNVIIRGWGATRLLRAIPHILTVRVCASMRSRVAAMVERLGVDERHARREILASDAEHASVIERLFGMGWRDPSAYDVVVNTDRVPIETAADVLMRAARDEAFAETQTSRGRLEDMLQEARVTQALRETADVGRRARDVHASVTDGEIRLYGLVRDFGAAHEIERTVRSQVPAGRIRNEIACFVD